VRAVEAIRRAEDVQDFGARWWWPKSPDR